MFLKIILLTFSMTLITNLSFADDSYYINKNGSAKFSGYLIPEETVKQLRNNTIERDAFKTQLDLTNQNVTLKDKEIQLLTDQNDKLATSLRNSETLNIWERAGYLLGGIIITGLAIKGAQQLK